MKWIWKEPGADGLEQQLTGSFFLPNWHTHTHSLFHSYVIIEREERRRKRKKKERQLKTIKSQFELLKKWGGGKYNKEKRAGVRSPWFLRSCSTALILNGECVCVCVSAPGAQVVLFQNTPSASTLHTHTHTNPGLYSSTLAQQAKAHKKKKKKEPVNFLFCAAVSIEMRITVVFVRHNNTHPFFLRLLLQGVYITRPKDLTASAHRFWW